MTNVAVIGAGLIGRAWSIVFARAGFQVTLVGPVPAAGHRRRWPSSPTACRNCAPPDCCTTNPAPSWPASSRCIRCGKRVRDADYIQENGPERVDVKRPLFAELDRAAQPDAIIASSSSGIPASAFTEDLKTRQRCLIAHPVNPPYLVPLVEICPAPWTDPAVVERTRDDHGAGRPGAGDGEEGNRRLRAEPPAGRAAGRGVPAAGRRRRSRPPISMRWSSTGWACAGASWGRWKRST